MIKQLFTLMWNQKKGNVLILIELVVTFLILFALAAVFVHNYRLYNLPMGFEVDGSWAVRIRTDVIEGQGRGEDYVEPVVISNIRNDVKQLLEQMPEVRGVYTINGLPYIGGGSLQMIYRNGETVRTWEMLVSEGLPEEIGLTLREGRWFGPEDEGRDLRAVVINKQLSNSLFPNESAVGKVIFDPPGRNSPAAASYRVVGVFDYFRWGGEFSPPDNLWFERDPMIGEIARQNLQPIFYLVVKANEALDMDFEERLYTRLSTLQSTLPILSIRVGSWDRLRQEYFINNISPLIVMAIMALFILVMVGFGLFGVLWQNVTRRTREIGVRRAMGATALAVQAQITLEIVVLSLFAIILGFVLVVQLPVSGYIAGLDWVVFWSSFFISSLVLALLCVLSSLYPSWLATKVDPVDALHYE